MNSFVEMTWFLLSENSESNLFLLSERISQDPLETISENKEHAGGGVTIRA